jgi:Ca2+-binding EF-hand superfamily protein
MPSTSATPSQDVEARKIFDQLDANHDGTLSFDEFSRATFRAR